MTSNLVFENRQIRQEDLLIFEKKGTKKFKSLETDSLRLKSEYEQNTIEIVILLKLEGCRTNKHSNVEELSGILEFSPISFFKVEPL